MNNLSESHVFVNIAAEQATIGGLLINSAMVDDVREIVSGDDFVNFDNQAMFAAICQLADDKKPVDTLTVCDQASKVNPNLSMAYVTDLHENTPSSVNVKAYAQLVKTSSDKRKIYSANNEIFRHINENPQLSGEDAIDFAQSSMMSLGDTLRREMSGLEMNQALKQYVDHLDYLHNQGDVIDGLACGLATLDSRVNGYKPGNLVVIAARPSMGKTTLALGMAKSFSVTNKKRGIFYSLEMSSNELMKKMISSVGNIPLHLLGKPSSASDDLWPRLSSAVSVCKDAPFQVVDCSGMHLNQLKAHVRKAHRRQPLDYFMVDHMHLMDADGNSQAERYGVISRELKRLAKELDIPVFLLAQLNRGVEQRTNKRPMSSDLRESGRIEEDADIIHMIYRDDFYNENSPNPGIAEIITTKFRGGEVGTDRFNSLLHISRFSDLSPGDYFPPAPKDNVTDMRVSL